MTCLAWQATGLLHIDPFAERLVEKGLVIRHRIIGMLDSARFETFIALELDVLPADVKAMVFG